MNAQARRVALEHYCRLACETAHPRFGYQAGPARIGLTVNAGYE